jgi:4-diphosphocytidyl-2-C-methyl-D-erythritol kinase
MIRAPAKLNLCLYLGPRRPDGLHELCSLFAPLTLADRIVVGEAEADAVVCPDVEGPNLAVRALATLRERGWSRPPVEVRIEKRIPLAAGLGGASADAAAVLRLARGEVAGIEQIAAGLGADVPSQLEPRFALVTAAGERVEPLPDPAEFAVVLVPSEPGLATANVYAEAERLGLGRSAAELEEIGGRLREAAAGGASPLGYLELLRNDLEPAALSLRPELEDALAALRELGAAAALITGSGPTAFGLFADLPSADRAASALPPRFASAIVAAPQAYRPQGAVAR